MTSVPQCSERVRRRSCFLLVLLELGSECGGRSVSRRRAPRSHDVASSEHVSAGRPSGRRPAIRFRAGPAHEHRALAVAQAQAAGFQKGLVACSKLTTALARVQSVPQRQRSKPHASNMPRVHAARSTRRISRASRGQAQPRQAERRFGSRHRPALRDRDVQAARRRRPHLRALQGRRPGDPGCHG
jgi:hypothetical protein